MFFNYLTALTQNSSYLNPRGYAILHRMHHAYSDTERDPHSPVPYRGMFPGLFAMMYRTKRIYHELAYFEKAARGRASTATSPSRASSSGWARAGRCASSGAPPSPCSTTSSSPPPGSGRCCPATGSWARSTGPSSTGPATSTATGTSTSTIDSKNTLPLDFLTAGELFQNNHHKYPMSPNFAARWFEIDTTYQVMRLFNWLGIIDMSRSQKMRYAPSSAVSPPAAG